MISLVNGNVISTELRVIDGDPLGILDHRPLALALPATARLSGWRLVLRDQREVTYPEDFPPGTRAGGAGTVGSMREALRWWQGVQRG
jgi:hypothetical protein